MLKHVRKPAERPARTVVLWTGFVWILALACTDVLTVIGRLDTEGPPASASGGQTPSGDGGSSSGFGGQTGGEGPRVISFEAEDGELSGALAAVAADGASGERGVSASVSSVSGPGEGRAAYAFEILEAGEYLIWGRIHSPSTSENRFWFRVDDGPWILWRISTGEEWYWDDLHDNFDYGSPVIFPLSAGTHRLELANAVTGATVDRFQVALLGDTPPSSSAQCEPPHSVLLSGTCVRSCGSYVNVSCIMEECAEREEVVVYDCAICCLL